MGTPMNPLPLLHSHRTTLRAMIAANNAANVDRIGRFILDGLNASARKLLISIDRDIATPGLVSAGWWGENGAAPEIADWVRQSEAARRMRAIAEAA